MFNNFSISSIPKQLKHFLILISIFSLLPSLLYNLPSYLGLSLSGLLNAFFWQPITFLFMRPNILEISFNSILQLFFYMFAIYTAGSEIIFQKKPMSFYILFFLPGIFSALFLIGTMYFFKTSYVVFGLAIPTYSLLTAFVMLGSNTQLLVFHTLPIKLSNIISSVFVVHLFLIASNISAIVALAHLLAVFIAYLYCLRTWQTHSPFLKLHRFERFIMGKKHNFELYDFKTKTKISVIDEILDNANEKGLNEKDKKKLKKFFQRKNSD